jgi:trans-2-enoyl-CoA reductase
MKLYKSLKSNQTSPEEFKKFLESNFQNLPISQTKIIIQELLTSIPSLPEYITVVSNYLFEKEEFKDCIVQSERIRNLQPFNYENLNLLSQAYLKIGEAKKSEKLIDLVNGLKS